MSGTLDAVVGQGANTAGGVFDERDTASPHLRHEGGPRLQWVLARPGPYTEDDVVGRHPRRVQVDDAVESGQPLGQAAGVGVVVGQPLDHAVGAVAQGDQSRRRQHADLAHAAAHDLARSAGPADEVGVADDDRSDRAGEALGQADAGTVDVGQQGGGGCAQRHYRVPQARAVHVQRHAHLVGHGGDRRNVCRRQRLAHRRGVRVLQGDQRRRWLMQIVGVSACRADVVELHGAVGAGRDLAHGGTGDDGVSTCLVLDDVRSGRGHDLTATRDVGHVRDEVAHGAAGDEEAGLLAGQLGRSLFERDDRWVVAEYVVTDLRRRHGAAHRRGRTGDGVGAQIDEVGHARRG